MDLKGSLVDTKLKIYPSKKLLNFLQNIEFSDNIPVNIAKLVKGEDFTYKNNNGYDVKQINFTLNNKDLEIIKKVKEKFKTVELSDTDTCGSHNDVVIKNVCTKDAEIESRENNNLDIDGINKKDLDVKDTQNKDLDYIDKEKSDLKKEGPYLISSDMDWLYTHLQERRSNGEKNVPYLHALLEGSHIELPENTVIKRNPILEERCVKLRAQQEAREYRKMTKSVDNVRMRFPEDSISYQLKQVNRQLIAVGQFILSIFAGFLFGFKGVEWMLGNLDFGFRLLLGVMCALIIALAEIYFLAKKLNEELNVPETIQLGGPPKFAQEPTCHGHKISFIDKEHKD